MIRTPVFIDPIAHSVEWLCLILHRRKGVMVQPADIKKVILFDIQHQRVMAPSKEECEALVECAIRGIEPEWATERYPRILTLLAAMVGY